jgi:hypothetical protein
VKVTVVAGLSLIAFLVAFRLTRVVPAAMHAVGVFREAMAAIGDRALTDQDRETIMRRGSGTLLVSFISILARSAIAIGAAMLPIGIADWAGWVPFAAVIAYFARIEVILGATVLVALGYFVFTRWRR